MKILKWMYKTTGMIVVGLVMLGTSALYGQLSQEVQNYDAAGLREKYANMLETYQSMNLDQMGVRSDAKSELRRALDGVKDSLNQMVNYVDGLVRAKLNPTDYIASMNGVKPGWSAEGELIMISDGRDPKPFNSWYSDRIRDFKWMMENFDKVEEKFNDNIRAAGGKVAETQGPKKVELDVQSHLDSYMAIRNQWSSFDPKAAGILMAEIPSANVAIGKVLGKIDTIVAHLNRIQGKSDNGNEFNRLVKEYEPMGDEFSKIQDEQYTILQGMMNRGQARMLQQQQGMTY